MRRFSVRCRRCEEHIEEDLRGGALAWLAEHGCPPTNRESPARPDDCADAERDRRLTAQENPEAEHHGEDGRWMPPNRLCAQCRRRIKGGSLCPRCDEDGGA